MKLSDKYPVSQGHCLIVPYRHVEKFSDLTEEELVDILALAKIEIQEIGADGYNLGWNLGQAAG